VAGNWRRPHNEELHKLYASLIITRVIKSRRIRWAWHVVLMGGMRLYKNLVRKLEGKKRPLG
jgi:hypothetical protein